MKTHWWLVTSVNLILGWALIPAPNPSYQTPLRPATVVVLDLLGDGLALSSMSEGVDFDIKGDGLVRRTAWTVRGSDDSFLVVDSNRNGQVDGAKEMIGTQLVLPGGAAVGSGANALIYPLQGYPLNQDSRPVAELPKPLPRGFAVLDKEDVGYQQLRLWNDRDHDGKVSEGELKTLSESNVVELLLGFDNYGWTAPLDSQGNRRVFGGKYRTQNRGVLFLRDLAEVVLASQQ